MKPSRDTPVVAAACLLAVLPGCGIGSDDAAPDDADIRTTVMTCFENEDIPARFEGHDGSDDLLEKVENCLAEQ